MAWGQGGGELVGSREHAAIYWNVQHAISQKEVSDSALKTSRGPKNNCYENDEEAFRDHHLRKRWRREVEAPKKVGATTEGPE